MSWFYWFSSNAIPNFLGLFLKKLFSSIAENLGQLKRVQIFLKILQTSYKRTPAGITIFGLPNFLVKLHRKILDTYSGFFSSGPSFRRNEFLKITRVWCVSWFGLDECKKWQSSVALSGQTGSLDVTSSVLFGDMSIYFFYLIIFKWNLLNDNEINKFGSQLLFF